MCSPVFTHLKFTRDAIYSWDEEIVVLISSQVSWIYIFKFGILFRDTVSAYGTDRI
jgi:hypothetical protein